MERTRLRLVVACFFKHIVSITVVALLVTGSVDCFISCKIMKPIVFVSESFLPEVFSATLSFSTLSLTVLSLIIGLMDTRMTGLKLREILSLNSSPVKFMFLICYCATLSFLSIFFYAMNWHTTITVIATLILMYTTYASITVFNLVSDSQYCSGIIMDEYGIEGIRFLNRYIFLGLMNISQRYVVGIILN